MRVLKIFKNGERIAGDTLAFITPFGWEVEDELDLSDLSDKEWLKVKANPKIHKFDKKDTKV